MSDTFFPSLTEAEETELQEVLLTLSETYHGMDFIQSHGFLSALSLIPEQVDRNLALSSIVGADSIQLNKTQKSSLSHFVDQAINDCQRCFYNDQVLELPCDLFLENDPNQSTLRGWAQGFMDGVYLYEDRWFQPEHAQIQSLLLPIAIAAGEQVSLPKSHPLSGARGHADCFTSIPESLTEIYFAFRDADTVFKTPSKNNPKKPNKRK